MPVDSAAPSGAITRWLLEWDRSGKQELDLMLPVAYQELRCPGSHYLSREATGHTLLVELKFFGGLTIEEITEVLQVSGTA